MNKLVRKAEVIMIATARKQVAHRKVRHHVPEGESREERFRRLAKRRIPKALKALNSIRKLASSNYQFTPEQAEKIVTVFADAMTEVVQAYRKSEKAQPPAFDI